MSRPCLPQHAPSPDKRRTELASQADTYRYAYDQFEGIACSPTVPPKDQPDARWAARVGKVVVDILVNAAHVERDLEKTEPGHPRHREVYDAIRDIERGGFARALDELQQFVQGEDTPPSWASKLTDYDELFHSIPLPAVASRATDDRWFARMRLAGPNPMEITGLQRVPDHFAVTEDHFQAAMASHAAKGVAVGRDSLEGALAEGRAFICDYSAFAGAEGGRFPVCQKYLYAPLALFVSTAGDRTLVPVAIQTGPAPGPNAPVVTPRDGAAWSIAKSMVQVADGNMHQAVRHLAHTHLVMGAFLISARRNLAPEHPIGRLLATHHEGTLYINENANSKLMAPGQGVDAVMSGSIELSRAAAIDGVKTWSFRDSMLPRNLRSRGLDNDEALPDAPYRDDGMQIWNAIHDWAEAFVRTYYTSDGDVAGDHELQAFFREAAATDGGRIRDVGEIGTIATLTDAITHLIFVPSAQHAAVNFPQLELMSYAPMFPLAGYSPPLSSMDVSEQDALRYLPPMDMAQYQATLGYLLGSVRHTQLGDYQVGVFSHFAGDARLSQPLAAFQARLKQIEHLITFRNEERDPYIYLLPSLIPQSINI